MLRLLSCFLPGLFPGIFLATLSQNALWAFDRAAPTLTKIAPPPLPLGVVSFPNGKAINLSVNIAAGAFHPREAPPSQLWTVTARGAGHFLPFGKGDHRPR